MADAVAAGMQPPLGTEARACVPLLNADVRTDIQWACYPGDYRSVKVYRLAITMALAPQNLIGGFRGL